MEQEVHGNIYSNNMVEVDTGDQLQGWCTILIIGCIIGSGDGLFGFGIWGC